MERTNVAAYFRVVLLLGFQGLCVADCDDNWVGFGDFCYKFETSTQLNWTSARGVCLDYGGDLVSIHSAEEQAFLESNTRSDTWIGLRDQTNQNVFEWSDMTNVIYRGSVFHLYNGDCVVLWRFIFAYWRGAGCYSQEYYICKRVHDCKTQAIRISNSFAFPDNRWTASSSKPGNEPYKARLNGAGAWAPATNGGTDYLQIDLGAVYVICSVATQGNPNADQWTTKYKVKTSTDKVGWTDQSNNMLIGNRNRNSTVKNNFIEINQGRFVRFEPVEYSGHKVLRVELYGRRKKGVVASPTDLTITSVHSRNATVHWKNPADDPAMRLGAPSNKLQYSSEDRTRYTTIPLTTKQTLTGLTPYTEYKVKVKVVTNAGMGLWSAEESFTTDSDVPEEAPTLTTSISFTPRTIHVTWQAPDKINGALVGYKVLYRNKRDDVAFVTETLTGSTTSHMLIFLKPTTEYEVKVLVYNSKGDGPASDAVKVRTLEDDCYSPPVLPYSAPIAPIVQVAPTAPTDPGIIVGLSTFAVLGFTLLVLVLCAVGLFWLRRQNNAPSTNQQARQVHDNPNTTATYVDLHPGTQTYASLNIRNTTQRSRENREFPMSHLNAGCQMYDEVNPSSA